MIGHTELRSQLERTLPPVLLLYGPAHIGKKTLVEHLISYHKIPRHNVVRYYKGLTIDEATYVRQTASARSLDGQRKVAAICLDFLASDAAAHALLKVLEEPPPVWFMLTASEPVLPTIASRAQVYSMGILSDAEVAQVLVSKGMDAKTAAALAPRGRGQVRPALAYQLGQGDRQRVVAALKASAVGDQALLERIMRQWDEESHRLLQVWAFEAATRCWGVFSADPALKLSKDDALTLLRDLSMASDARPALAASVALGSLASRRSH